MRPGNTPLGTNVSVQTTNASVTFGNVITGGNTTFTPIDPNTAGTPPDGFVACPTCPAYDITTTATFVPPITVCLDVPASIDAATFNLMYMLAGENGVLVTVTVSRVTNPDGTREICGSVDSLSPFLQPQQIPPPSAPAAPSNLIATANSTSQITLTWRDNSDNEQGFRIERCTPKGKMCSFVQIAEVIAGSGVGGTTSVPEYRP